MATEGRFMASFSMTHGLATWMVAARPLRLSSKDIRHEAESNDPFGA